MLAFWTAIEHARAWFANHHGDKVFTTYHKCKSIVSPSELLKRKKGSMAQVHPGGGSGPTSLAAFPDSPAASPGKL
eukprot:135027-Prorocentrum_minimum.AAC.1